MKRTIVLETNSTGRTTILESIMKGALAFGYGITKRTIVFNSKKEAIETLSEHPCRKGCKFYTLSKKQSQIIADIKSSKSDLYIDFIKFEKAK